MEKVDIFAGFRSLNAGQHDWYDQLDAKQQKTVTPLVFLMWMKSSSDDNHILRLNNGVNRYAFRSLSKHPDVSFSLLSLAARKKQHRYQWVKPPSSKTVKVPEELSSVFLEYFPHASNSEVETYSIQISVDEFKEIAIECGRDSAEVKKLITALNKHRKGKS